MKFQCFIVPRRFARTPCNSRRAWLFGRTMEIDVELIRYEAACRAIAEVKSIDEVKEFKNRAQAARAYARQSKNKQLELDALEIRVRAERRLGEIIADLMQSKTLRVSGVRDHTERGKESPLKLSDIGINSDESGIARRLASVPSNKFEDEISDWRRAMESSSRVEVPLQFVRLPTIRADRERAAHRSARVKLNASDPFARFVSNDGRRIAGWRMGELQRLEAIFLRLARCAKVLAENNPVANADPLSAIEANYKTAELTDILERCFADSPIPSSGLTAEKATASRAARIRICQHCQTQFVMDNRGNTAGKFCSRQCAFASRRENSARSHG